uniref:Uncharacterized protein n=1 Tax=Arundo donax TaxID=35708 RepID=A0A0A9CW49_ARUDO
MRTLAFVIQSTYLYDQLFCQIQISHDHCHPVQWKRRTSHTNYQILAGLVIIKRCPL